jgi:ribonuclease HI
MHQACSRLRSKLATTENHKTLLSHYLFPQQFLRSQPKSKKINYIKQVLKHLQAFKKIVVFQWVSSHVGLEGNETAN